MKHNLIAIVAWIVPVMLYSQEQSPFHPPYMSSTSHRLSRTLTNSDTISLENLGKIYSLSIDATIQQPHESSFTRIVLEDTNGHEYLVAESDWFRNDSTIVNLSDYCEETAIIDGIIPFRLKCYLASDALLTITCLHYSTQSPEIKSENIVDEIQNLKKAQIGELVERINRYNKKKGKLWRAGITKYSLQNYGAKKEFVGEQDSYLANLQHYADGIYEIAEKDNSSSIQLTRETTSSPYISDFDWRHRHGRNMMTSVKHQGESGYCAAFAINGMLEARANLYFNQKIDLDLSEQDIVYNYARAGHKTLSSIYTSGMNIYTALGDVIANGVLDEASVPFIDSILHVIPPRPEGYECIQIYSRSMQTVSDTDSSIDNLKSLLINNGPFVSSFGSVNNWHGVTLTGFHTIHAGDTISRVFLPEEGGLFSPIVVPENSPYIGDIYWVVKDSYGLEEEGRHGGYLYLWFKSYSRMGAANYTTSPIISRHYEDADIICEDIDGDGYYNWGIGPRPSHCPAWAPSEPDGDDSDATLGPMDEYGYCVSITPYDTIFIDNNEQYSSSHHHIIKNICIRNNSTLTVDCDLVMSRLAEIRIKSGSTLIVNGCIRNANIKPEVGSSIFLNNGGKIITHHDNIFELPVGAILQINNGAIE